MSSTLSLTQLQTPDKNVTIPLTSIVTSSNFNTQINSYGAFNFRNKLVDGKFDFWYEGTSQTSSAYASDTMWFNSNSGTTKTHSQQALTVGVDLPSIDVPTATYFSRTVVTSVAGSANYAAKFQNMEDVRRFAGKTVTVSFYAKADATRNIALTMAQVFGTTGASSTINGIGAQLVALSTSWKRYTAQITLPSVSGKTITTGNYTQLCFWFDAGSSTVGALLGQQSGTFDIACVQLEEGSTVTPFEDLPYEISKTRVDRYFQYINLSYAGMIWKGYQAASTTSVNGYCLGIKMRTTPTASIIGTFTTTNVSSWTFIAISENFALLSVITSSTTGGTTLASTATSAFQLDARL